MPIRFRCKRCRQLLGIASRKAGSDIECPKCGISQAVPAEEAASAALAMDQLAKTQVAFETASDLVVYDDQPAAIETPRPRPAQPAGQRSAPTASGVPIPDAPPLPPADQPGRPVPRGMILFPRRILYVQGLLLLIVGLAAFALGYFIGRGDANYKLMVQQEEASREHISGKLVYDQGGGKLVGDRGAVVIALPDGVVRKKVSFDGIRPQDPELSEPRRSVRLIRELGGEYTRAKPSGDFDMVVPDKGSYHLLIISGNTTRPRETPIHEVDFSEIDEYFTDPQALIGQYEYRWLSIEVNAGLGPIEVQFTK